MQSNDKRIVILGTGGTIAGLADDASRPSQYAAGKVSAEALVAAIPALGAVLLQVEQVAQVDSKDMSFAVWADLAQRVAHHMADADVAGVVITHGTDTLEETAFFLQRLLAPPKPVVLTAAMRPANALQADGPQNLLDAVTVAATLGAQGVMAVVGGQIFSGLEVRKSHSWKLDAFSAGESGPLGTIRDEQVRWTRAWPDSAAIGIDALPREDDAWPWVEIVLNTAGASGAVVRALTRAGVHGLVAAGTGNGTLHADLIDALMAARDEGVAVLRCTRCESGGVSISPDASLPVRTQAQAQLTPVQARVELMLELMLRVRAS